MNQALIWNRNQTTSLISNSNTTILSLHSDALMSFVFWRGFVSSSNASRRQGGTQSPLGNCFSQHLRSEVGKHSKTNRFWLSQQPCQKGGQRLRVPLNRQQNSDPQSQGTCLLSLREQGPILFLMPKRETDSSSTPLLPK